MRRKSGARRTASAGASPTPPRSGVLPALPQGVVKVSPPMREEVWHITGNFLPGIKGDARGAGREALAVRLGEGSSAPDAPTSTIDHIAFEIPLADFADEKKKLEALGLQVETAEHAWVHWRSLYVTDPEGNQVELVCYDDSV